MFWYKTKLPPLVMLLVCSVVFTACKPDVNASDGQLKYFDINGYFAKEIAKLNEEDHSVLKTVVHNGKSETKTVHIKNWNSELGLFKDADINKPAWKDSYTILSDGAFLMYKAKDSRLKVREILIKRTRNKINWILIFTRAQNFLYHTTTKLSYYPDSAYQIEMDQRVRIVGFNRYLVNGLIR